MSQTCEVYPIWLTFKIPGRVHLLRREFDLSRKNTSDFCIAKRRSPTCL